MNTAHNINVSIADVVEVRGTGLEPVELLALATTAADSLPPCPRGTVFDPENIFISNEGKIIIRTVPSETVEPEFIPPEWERGQSNESAAAVYCLGAVLRSCGAQESNDVQLFSLVNILTVGHVDTRPTANRMSQIARKQLGSHDPHDILISLYEEIMGDEESNQIPEGGLDIDDLDIGDDLSASVTIPTVKKAVEYIEEDEKDGRATSTSTSTSSGNSTQKDSSPFEEEEEDIEEEEVHEHEVPNIGRTTFSPKNLSTPILEIGSPIGNSTRLNDSYVEEHSINSFNDNFVKTAEVSPFDGDEIHHGGTLSGRDPFADESLNRSQNKSLQRSNVLDFSKSVVEERTVPTKSPLMHRFSSSSDEIVDVSHHKFDVDFMKPKSRASYFDDIVDDDHIDSMDKLDQKRDEQEKYEKINTKPSHIYEAPVIAPPRSRRNSANVQLDRLKEQTDSIRATVEKLNEDSHEIDHEINRSHVDAVVITESRSPFVKRAQMVKHHMPETPDEAETPIDLAFSQAMSVKHTSVKTVVEDSPVPTPKASESPRLERKNSLAASRISGRASSRGKRKTRALPEFYDNSRHPSIRLKAPSAKKKKLTIMRIEQSEVLVELLNGQRVEVSCRTDVIARDIFSLVVQHMNINEHIFFGLSYKKDNEHFFIDEEQRLEKFAPPGWKIGTRGPHKHNFVLFLRFRFYPQMLEFIKTETTMHELYLQVRHDVIDERIQPKRDVAYDLAAFALQAEFGNRPPPAVLDYFDNYHYLPRRYCSNDDQKRLAELHGQHKDVSSYDAEYNFIKICQQHGEFGAHLHRVFRNKPVGSVGADPLDPDTGASLWIAIMPRGITVYEEQGGIRIRRSEHQWPETQTLQFDKKRFVIVSGQHDETILFTDHHSKSSYFVKFSASQHQFMMKMRKWKTTLRHENTIQAMPDVCVEGRSPPSPINVSASPLENASSLFEMMPSSATASDNRVQMKSQDDFASSDTETNSHPNIERFEPASGPDSNGEYSRMQFEVTIKKDPTTGLGLTLVDGNLNGVKGVYIKSVAENGAGMQAGIHLGDRLVSIDGQSIEGADRHLAVEFVKKSGAFVKMEIARLDGFVRHEKSTSRDSADVRKKSSTLPAGLAPPSTKGVSRTPPAPRKAANRRQRAVSDFGAIGDSFPTFNIENTLDMKAISGINLDESDEERGEFRLPTSSMYSFDHHDEDEIITIENKSSDYSRLSEDSSSHIGKRKTRYTRKSNLDSTDEVDEEREEDSDDDDEENDLIEVSLERNSTGSIGVQIASVGGRVCIKQLTASPAAGHPRLKIGMQLISVNGHSVSGCTHQEVVSMLRSGGSTVVLGLRKEEKSDEAKDKGAITVTLNKQQNEILGIALAKRTGAEGIFIRTITEGSVAALEGSLKVGDRILAIDDEPTDRLSPSTIHNTLKQIIGPVRISVAR
ncbi:unnamed protein product [Auanema sp. JU1783]|nr:unnamed protein product [Auanema sp. JU1783]